MLICICCVNFITRLRVSFCIKFLKIEKKEKKKKGNFHHAHYGIANANHDVTDSEICVFHKNTKI